MPLPKPGHPVVGLNGVYRLPNFASCSVWGFTEGELAIMREAVLEWEEATDGKVSVRLDTGPSIHCEIIPTKTCPLRTGYTHRSPVMIVIELDTKCAGASLKALMLHELGHAFGVEHQTSGIMMGNKWSGAMCVDPVAIRAFCEVHQCSPNVRSTCSDG